MKLNKKYVFFGMISLVIILSVIFFIGNSKVLTNEDYTLPEKIKNIKLIPAIDIDIFNKNKGYSTSPSFERKVLIQTEVDENFPCYVQNGDTIVCKAINESKKEKYLSTLSPVDASLLDSGSVPITNIEGSVIRERNINWNRDTEIKIDLTSQSGKFIIGFGSNEFILTTLSNGVFNLTHESGGDIYLDASELTGSYFTELIDLNKTQSVVNISFESTQPSGTDIGVLVRTHNLTNGSDLSYDLQRYWKLDAPTGTSVFDYSGNNDTGTFVGTPTPTSEGKFDNAIVFDSKYDYIDIDSDIFDYVERTTPYTISLWFKANTLDRGRLISITHSYSERHVMNIYSNELMTCLYDGSFHCKSIAFTDTTNWHNIIMIHDGSQGITAYLDGSEMTGTTAEGTAGGTYSRIGSDGTYGFNGIIDEVAIWNRTLSSAEVTQLYSMGQVGAWSDWTSRFTSSPSSFTVDDGRYVQVKSEIERPGGENVYLESITIGYTDVGVAPTPDNPPETFLNTTDAITFTEPEANLSCAGHDDFDIVNISIYTDANGTWLLNQTESFSGIQTKAEASFNISGISDGTYNWSCLSCDNASSTQCDMADNNRTFTISTSCIDEECYPYLCNDVTQTCRTSCTSHSHVNASSYCASDGTAKPAEPDLSDCANKEWSSLTDDEVCIDQSSGYCYDDNIGATGEYCVDVSTECVNDGTSYSEGEFICGFGDGNDHYQCLGGESAWSGLTDCIDLGDPYDASATVSGHTYCGYYEASTCSALTGCSTPTTQDCGNYYYDGSSCGTAKEDCDTGCGAAYDLDTCNEEVGYTLSEDCSTCTPPTTDVPPIVSLTSPDDDSISSSLEVTFGYTVAEDWNIRNCTFWHNASGSYHLNQTNTTEIAFDGSTINYFTQTFKDNQFPSWTIYCCDNATTPQCDWGSNRTVIIQTTYVGERKFRFFNESYGNEVFSISQHGDVNISTGELSVTNDAYIYGTLRGDSNGLDIDKLVISDYLDINGAGTSRIRLSNPYNEYLKLTGETGIGSLLIGLFNKNPYISTETGDYIEFGNDLRVGGDIRTTTLNVTGNAHITNINPDGNALYIGGEYEDGGVTIQYGNIFARNLTVNDSLISSGTIQTGGSIIPNATDVYDIGEVDTIWRYGFFRGLNVSDEVYINDVPVSPWLYNMSLSPTITPWLYNMSYALLSKIHRYTAQQNFEGILNITNSLELNNNATITRSGVNTSVWISETGNLITKFGKSG